MYLDIRICMYIVLLGCILISNIYVQCAAWVYLDIRIFMYMVCLGVSRYTNIYVQGAAWVYLLLGSAGQGEGGCTGEDRVSASSGIASGTSSQPWLEDQVFIYSLITLEH